MAARLTVKRKADGARICHETDIVTGGRQKAEPISGDLPVDGHRSRLGMNSVRLHGAQT